MSESFAGLAKMTWAMFGTIAVEETGNLLEGKLIVTAGQSSHRLGYKLNVSNGGYDVSTITSSIRRRISSEKLPTPLAGNESFTLHLSNQLGESSYSANAEARFADYGLAASVEGLVRQGGFQAQMDGRYNDRVIVLKVGGSLDEKRVTCNVNLATPYEELKSLEIFVQLERDLAESCDGTSGFYSPAVLRPDCGPH